MFFIALGFLTITCFSVSALNHCNEGIPVYNCNYYYILEDTACEWKPEPSKEMVCILSGFNLSITLEKEYNNDKEKIYELIAESCFKHDTCKQKFNCHLTLLYPACN